MAWFDHFSNISDWNYHIWSLRVEINPKRPKTNLNSTPAFFNNLYNNRFLRIRNWIGIFQEAYFVEREGRSPFKHSIHFLCQFSANPCSTSHPISSIPCVNCKSWLDVKQYRTFLPRQEVTKNIFHYYWTFNGKHFFWHRKCNLALSTKFCSLKYTFWDFFANFMPYFGYSSLKERFNKG